MFITSQIVFRLLSEKLTLTQWEFSETNKKVRTPKLYRGQELQPEHLYILDELTDFCSMGGVENCAFLILSHAPHMLPDAFRCSDVAFVKSGVNKLDLFDEVNSIFNTLLDWDMQLKDACYGGAPTIELMQIGSRLIDAPLTLYDGGRNKRITAGGRGETRDSNEIYEMFLDHEYKCHLNEKCVYACPEGLEEEKNLYRNVFYRGKTIAVFIANMQRKQIHEGEKALFRHLSEYVSASHLNEVGYVQLRKKNEEQQRALGEILFGEHPKVTPEIRSLLARFGWREEHCYRVAVLQEIRRPSTALDSSYLRHRIENDWQDTCLLTAGSRFVWVINDTLSQKGTNRDLRDYFSWFIREHMLKAGLSDSSMGLGDMNSLYGQACASLTIGQRKHPHQWMFAFEDYRLDYVLEKFCCEFPAEQTVHRGVYRLIAYDRENSTDYVKTLRCYIENQFNASIAAEKVYVHRSTFLRRIERIEELSGINLQNPDELLHVMISLKVCDQLGYARAKIVS